MQTLRETLRRRIGWTHTGTAALILLAATFGFEPSDIPANPVPDSISDNAMSFNAMSFNAMMMHPNEKLADWFGENPNEARKVVDKAISAARARQRPAALGFTVLTVVMLYALMENIVEKPDGLAISGLFILGIVAVSLVSRVSRTTELRVERIEFQSA